MAHDMMTAARDSDSAARAAWQIERLVRYALHKEMVGTSDLPYVRNQLLDLFHIAEPCAGYGNDAWNDVPDEPQSMLEDLLDYAYGIGMIPDNTGTRRYLLDAKIMGLLMPRPSETNARFERLRAEKGIERATDDFYELSKNCNYIRMNRVRKNEYWLHHSKFGAMEMTINLSKPEKSPQEIAQAGQASISDYPQCLLCVDNVGYAGRLNHPARQNLRVIPLQLNEETWFFQYSPYVYYNEHSIIFRKEHVPMTLTRSTFSRLLAFTEQFPHYFIGSNADLPIVGGSILSHDHFQAGRHTFPIERAPMDTEFTHSAYPGVTGGIVQWPMSVLRLRSDIKDMLLQCADEVYEQWKRYSDPSVEVLASTSGADGEIRHNTVTPIVRRHGALYEMDLVLRNNRTSEQHPEGIFHPHRHLHHIKKENIGLIEVMGLAILPGRLQQETGRIASLLTGRDDWQMLRLDEKDALYPHAAWIDAMLERAGTTNSPAEAMDIIRSEIGTKFVEILGTAGVFKRDSQGQEAFRRFAAAAGFQS